MPPVQILGQFFCQPVYVAVYILYTFIHTCMHTTTESIVKIIVDYSLQLLTFIIQDCYIDRGKVASGNTIWERRRVNRITENFIGLQYNVVFYESKQ